MSLGQLKMVVPLETCTREEQHSIIQFLSSEGVKPIEIHRRMKTQFGDACLLLQQMYEWDRKFKNLCQVYMMLNAQVALTLPLHQRQWSMLNKWYGKIIFLQLLRLPCNLVLTMAVLTILWMMYFSTTKCVPEEFQDNSHQNWRYSIWIPVKNIWGIVKLKGMFVFSA